MIIICGVLSLDVKVFFLTIFILSVTVSSNKILPIYNWPKNTKNITILTIFNYDLKSDNDIQI